MFLSFLVPFRSMVRGSSHPSVDILVLVPYSNHGTRTRMSTDKSRASNQRSSTRPRRAFSRRAGSSTRSRRGFSRRAKTRTRSRWGFSQRAKTRTRTRRVLLSPHSTALITSLPLPLSCLGLHMHIAQRRPGTQYKNYMHSCTILYTCGCSWGIAVQNMNSLMDYRDTIPHIYFMQSPQDRVLQGNKSDLLFHPPVHCVSDSPIMSSTAPWIILKSCNLSLIWTRHSLFWCCF